MNAFDLEKERGNAPWQEKSGLMLDAVKSDERTKALDDGGDYRAVNPLG